MLYISTARPGLAVPGSLIPSSSQTTASDTEALGFTQTNTSSATPSGSDTGTSAEATLTRLTGTDTASGVDVHTRLEIRAAEIMASLEAQTPPPATFTDTESLGFVDSNLLYLSSSEMLFATPNNGELSLTSVDGLHYTDTTSTAKTFIGTGLVIVLSSITNTSITPAIFDAWLTTIQQDHPEINSIIVQDIANINGTMYTPYLDVLIPYLPGGSKPVTFDDAYIGTVDLPWTGTGTKFVEGIQNSTFRSSNVTLSGTVAAAFKAAYPSCTADWFITYGADLSDFSTTAVSTAYATYVNALMAALNAVTTGKNYMWGPSMDVEFAHLFAPDLWGTYVNTLQTNLVTFSAAVTDPLIVNLFDGVGTGTGEKGNAVAWTQYLSAYLGTNLEGVLLDAEQYQIVDGTRVAASADEVTERSQYYTDKGITLGPAWDIVFWHLRNYP